MQHLPARFQPVFITVGNDGHPYLLDANYYYDNDTAALFSLLSPECKTHRPTQTSVDGWPIIENVMDNFYDLHWLDFVADIKSRRPELFI